MPQSINPVALISVQSDYMVHGGVQAVDHAYISLSYNLFSFELTSIAMITTGQINLKTVSCSAPVRCNRELMDDPERDAPHLEVQKDKNLNLIQVLPFER